MPNRTTSTPKSRVAGLDDTQPAVEVVTIGADDLRGDGLGEVDTTQPLDQRNGEIVPAGNGRSATDIAYGDLIRIVRHAERQVYDGQAALRVETELANARRQMQARDHVDLELLRAIKRDMDAWVAHAEAGEDGGS